jgi:hypothetical protein
MAPAPPKIVYATPEELGELRAELIPKLQACESKIEPLIKKAENSLKEAIKAVHEMVQRHDTENAKKLQSLAMDSKAYTDECIKKLHGEVFKQFPLIHQKIDALAATLRAEIQEGDKRVEGKMEMAVTEMCQNFEEEMEQLKALLLGKVEETHVHHTTIHTETRTDMDEKVREVRKEQKAVAKKLMEKGDGDLKKAMQEQADKDTVFQTANSKVQNDIYLHLDRHAESLKAIPVETAANLAAAELQLNKTIGDLRADHGGRLDHLDAETSKLRAAVAEVENLATKRVDWVIKSAAQVIRPNSASKASLHRSWFSPKFNMAGSHGLQLELQLFRPSDPPREDEADGDVAVFLWAARGTNISYRLYVGDKYQQMDKLFNGRVPFGTKRFCWMKDCINRVDNTLRIGVEILESHREVEHEIVAPPEPKEVDQYMSPPDKTLEGMVQFHRHINNRLYEQVKNQVDLMRSRMIRRVEWRVEQASRLRQCFAPGQPICSTQFNAAGLEGLQLLFYPSGYKGATDGFCSLYMYGPAGCTIRCSLFLGEQKREAYHSFVEPGAFGRTNFCRFESITDESEDSVLVAIEVEEAHQDSSAKVAHALVAPGDRRNQAQLDGASGGPINSVVKLQGHPGKPMQGLEDTRILPSLWTAVYENSAVPEGMHSFEEIKHSQTRGSPSQDRGERDEQQGWTMKVSDSMPLLKRDLDAGSTTMSPLPHLARSTGDLGRSRSGGASTGPRRTRRAASAAASPGATAVC